MKTAISLPDDTFARVSRRALELGMSRSEFFARAAERYLDDLDADSVTQQIDEVLANQALTSESSGETAVQLGHKTVFAGDDW